MTSHNFPSTRQSMRQSILVGNWKMNNPLLEWQTFFQAYPSAWGNQVEVILCPPATLLPVAPSFFPLETRWGGQSASAHEAGAFTGDVSAPLLKEAGATHCLVGHSERRLYHGEKDAEVREACHQLWKVGMIPIICIGEDAAAYQSGDTAALLQSAVETIVAEAQGPYMVAYEPRWAIGTGKTPSLREISLCLSILRKLCPQASLLYGGSVSPYNAQDIWGVPELDGLLLGGASLDPVAFMTILTLCAGRAE